MKSKLLALLLALLVCAPTVSFAEGDEEEPILALVILSIPDGNERPRSMSPSDINATLDNNMLTLSMDMGEGVGRIYINERSGSVNMAIPCSLSSTTRIPLREPGFYTVMIDTRYGRYMTTFRIQ